MKNQSLPQPEERRLSGTPASGGFGAGPLFVQAETANGTVESALPPYHAGSTEVEKSALEDALGAASVELSALLETLNGSEEGIIEFQIAMLEDETVSEAAFEAVAQGTPALVAWRSAITTLVNEYRSASDAYFRDRAGDIIDIQTRVEGLLCGQTADGFPAGSIVVATDVTPTRFLETDWNGGGVALFEGSASSHVAMLARARGVPLLVGLERADLQACGEALIDGDSGQLIVDPSDRSRSEHEHKWRDHDLRARDDETHLDGPAVTAAGETVAVYLNVASSDDLEGIEAGHCDGIGLVRTEFLFHDDTGLPDEDAQFEAYRTIVEWAEGRPVTFRTLDAGGDKPIAGLTVDDESNPFLGVRGYRLSLLHPDVFETQLRALLRVAALGPVKIMVPMITTAEEFAEARGLFEKTREQLSKEDVEIGEPAFGMMVEVPAAAIAIEEFDAGFFSIGSNDLIQYVTACGRDNRAVGHLMNPELTAVTFLLERVATHGRDSGREVSLCGDLAADRRYAHLLLDCGLRALSVAPSALAACKAEVATYGGKADG